MAAHSLETLLRLWALNHLSSEQAIGQILQILFELEPRVKRVEQTLVTVQSAMPKPAPPPNPILPPVVKKNRRARRK